MVNTESTSVRAKRCYEILLLRELTRGWDWLACCAGDLQGRAATPDAVVAVEQRQRDHLGGDLSLANVCRRSTQTQAFCVS